MSEPYEFTISGTHQFQGTKLAALDQGKMLKRIMPLIPPLIPVFDQLDLKAKTVDLVKFAALAGPFADALISLKDEDLDWLIQTSAASVRYNQDGKWMVFWNRAAKRCMFKDLDDLAVLLPLTVSVIQENLTPFFLGLLTSRKKDTEEPETIPP